MAIPDLVLDRRRLRRELQQAYQQGWHASYRGETIAANPYLSDYSVASYQRWQYWRYGFKSAEWEQ